MPGWITSSLALMRLRSRVVTFSMGISHEEIFDIVALVAHKLVDRRRLRSEDFGFLNVLALQEEIQGHVFSLEKLTSKISGALFTSVAEWVVQLHLIWSHS